MRRVRPTRPRTLVRPVRPPSRWSSPRRSSGSRRATADEPGRRPASSPRSARSPSPRPGTSPATASTSASRPTQSAMDAWWKKSPFSAVGIYISGDSRACRTQPNLSPTWVATQVARGWRLLPIALGPQASCQPRFPRYKDDFKISNEPDRRLRHGGRAGCGRGRQERRRRDDVRHRRRAARSGTTSRASTSPTPTAASPRWSSRPRWVTRIKALGYVAGFYSSASSGIKMLDDARVQRPGQFALPDRIWIARWDGARQHLDDLHPRGRLASRRPDEAVPRRPQRDVGRRDDQHRQQLPRPRRRLASRVPRAAAPAPGSASGSTPRSRPPSAQSTRVKALQCLLTEQGTYSGPINGSYDAATIAAPAPGRRARKFTPSDTFEKRHWTALLAAGARTTIKRGSTDESVHRLQRALNAAGAGRFRATGVFDAKTEAAAADLPVTPAGSRVSGVATRQTWNKLQQGR